MTKFLYRILLALGCAATGGHAFAQACTVTANNLSTGSAYNPFLATSNDTSGLFSITCTRPRGGQNRFPAQFLVGANNGGNFAGGTRRLRMGASANYLNYALYRNYAGCSQVLGSAAGQTYTLNNSNTRPNSTTTNPNPLTAGTTYCLRINALQPTAPPGTYTDTVNFTVASSTGTVWGLDPVTFTTTILPACSFTTPPPNITLNYTSFATVPSTGASNFQLRCTRTTTYAMALSATSGTAMGLNYTLALSAAAGTGSGLAQSYAINANMPAGQSGTCAGASCTATVSRTLTVTY